MSTIRPVWWIGSAKKDFLAFPLEVVREVGFALRLGKNPVFSF
jgi:phage-related protein